MPRTRAQTVALEGQRLSSSSRRAIHRRGIQKTAPVRIVNSRLQRRLAREKIHKSSSSPIENVTQQLVRGEKRPATDDSAEPNREQKRSRRSPTISRVKELPPAVEETRTPLHPIGYWAQENHWPREYFVANMDHLLSRKKLVPSRKRSNSATSSTSSDQRPREEKSAPYRDPRYEMLLNTKGSFMSKSSLDISHESKTLATTLLETEQEPPTNTTFRDEAFEYTCQMIHNRNEARVVQDISRLIVPSAEALAFESKHLRILAESVNDGWGNSIPLTGTRPQPDYAVGFAREAFTDSQLDKISPLVGDIVSGDRSFFMATYYMYFPFLTCEVKCGAAALDVADRQNAHSMTLAVRAVAELFRTVGREKEVHRQILAFSISHDHRSVRIYGHYPVITGNSIKYYRHPIHDFSFSALDGREKWTAFRFTKNVYDSWMPSHFKNICSAIDMLPLAVEDSTPVSTGLSQSLHSHSLSELSPDLGSTPCEEKPPDNSKDIGVTARTSVADSDMGKRRKGRK